jgi:dTDP-L-rhamnose 4-epimerase
VAESVLITGGAGFIGSHLADELLGAGYSVRALDSLVDQVHGDGGRPGYLNGDVELITGDVRNDVVRGALEGVDSVVHLAARVGVGQSMYAPGNYTAANSLGTARRGAARPTGAQDRGRLEHEHLRGGRLRARTGGRADPRSTRARGVGAARAWRRGAASGCDSRGQAAGAFLDLRPHEVRPGAALPALRCGLRRPGGSFFNVYGPRQALSNPYTGALAIFAAQLLNDRPPVIYEDGGQRRDFVNVADVARACRLALERDGADGRPVNIGSGRSATVLEIAGRLGRVLGKEIAPELPGTFRAGDIRHCFADVTLAREELGFEAEVALEDGMAALSGWLEGQVATDRFDDAAAELAERGLTR